MSLLSLNCRLLAPAVLVLALLGPSAAAPGSTPTPSASPTMSSGLLRWPALSGFRSETIPFPLGFAPELIHRGVEVIRYAPGWDDPKAPDYFTYAFIWLLEPPAKLEATPLKSELHAYFQGLMASVASRRNLKSDPLPTYVTVLRGRPPRNEPTFPVRPSFRAEVMTWDAFHTGQKLILQIDIFEPKSPVLGHPLYYFEVSPNPSDPGVRDNFLKMRRQLEL